MIKKENHKKYNFNSFLPKSINSTIFLDEKFNIKVKYNKLNINEKENKNSNNQFNLNYKIQQILCQSQQEIIKIKKDFEKHFTAKNSPIKCILINNHHNNISIIKKIQNNSKNKNKSFQIQKNNFLSKKNSDKKLLNFNKKKYKIIEKKKKKEKIENEKINFKRIRELKNSLLIKQNKSEINNNNNDFNQNQNYYLKESIKLSNYIKDYHKKNKEYPKTNLNFYKYGRIIGQGAFGKVNIGLNILTGRIVAIKSFDKKKLSMNSENMKKIIYESNLMKKLNHPNITKILEMFEDEQYFLIIMEYINGGNLFSFVKKRRKLSEKTAKFLFRQIILGIQHIHSKKIVHRDIKLENILIDLNNNIKICDFGISLVLNSLSEILYEQCGTPMYMAPEILSSNKKKRKGYIGPPVDIWSAGIALYIMLSGNLPFNINDSSYDFKKGKEYLDEYSNNILLQYCILRKEPKKIEGISELAKDILKGILNKNPKKRLNCEEILNHPWLFFDDNYKYHLFTKAEMIMLSKTFVDYRYNKIEDLLENFTISNLKCDNNKNIKKSNSIDINVNTKSSILTPYNSLIYDDNLLLKNEIIKNSNIFDDEKNEKVKITNEFIIFSNKAKELNMLYELNNNGEIDNGILINSKTNSSTSNRLNNSENEFNNNIKDKNYEFNWSSNFKNKENKIERMNYILDKIVLMGYDKKYTKKIINNNELSHVYAIYFLLNNYDNI